MDREGAEPPHECGYSKVVDFPDQSASFANGVEAGKLFERMKASDASFDEITMTANREVLFRMAEYRGFRIEHRCSDIEGWDRTRFIRTRPRGERINPHGLKVVKPVDNGPPDAA